MGPILLMFSIPHKGPSEKMNCCILSGFSHVRLCDPMDQIHQTPLSMGLSRQECWSGLPSSPLGHLSNPAINQISYISCIGRRVLYHLGSPNCLPHSLNIAGGALYSGEGTGNPLQYSCLETPMDGGACRLQSMRVGHD